MIAYTGIELKPRNAAAQPESSQAPMPDLLFHATALSNFARGFDKYSRIYDKSLLPRVTYPGQFFLLAAEELEIGLRKARDLVARLAIPGDEVLVLATEHPPASSLLPNLRTGLGRYIESDRIPVHSVYRCGQDGGLKARVLEDAMAQSLLCLEPLLTPYEDLVPRTLSILPIARACQAACKFCFSEASVSLEQEAGQPQMARLDALCREAQAAGASRFVITGGGEPGLLKHERMLDLIRTGAAHFAKTVLFTNGEHLARRDDEDRKTRMRGYAEAGLSTLAVSRHHADSAVNAEIMGLDTRTERVVSSWNELRGEGACFDLRLICVLQKGGVEDLTSLEQYLSWAARRDIRELCFKELYVSSTLESAYHDKPENQWSRDHQVPLALLLTTLPALGFQRTGQLPWGAPVFEGEWNGAHLRIAAYTEPSLLWERTNGLARSWNLMADGSCLASLEDPRSSVRNHVCKPSARVVRLFARDAVATSQQPASQTRHGAPSACAAGA